MNTVAELMAKAIDCIPDRNGNDCEKCLLNCRTADGFGVCGEIKSIAYTLQKRLDKDAEMNRMLIRGAA